MQDPTPEDPFILEHIPRHILPGYYPGGILSSLRFQHGFKNPHVSGKNNRKGVARAIQVTLRPNKNHILTKLFTIVLEKQVPVIEEEESQVGTKTEVQTFQLKLELSGWAKARLGPVDVSLLLSSVDHGIFTVFTVVEWSLQT